MFYRHTTTGFIWEVPGKTVDEAAQDLLAALMGMCWEDFAKSTTDDDLGLVRRVSAVLDELPLYAAEEHPGAEIIDIKSQQRVPEMSMPEITVMGAEAREALLGRDVEKSFKVTALEFQSRWMEWASSDDRK